MTSLYALKKHGFDKSKENLIYYESLEEEKHSYYRKDTTPHLGPFFLISSVEQKSNVVKGSITNTQPWAIYENPVQIKGTGKTEKNNKNDLNLG